MPAPSKYPQELRERAMRLVQEAPKEDPELSLDARWYGAGTVPVPEADNYVGALPQQLNRAARSAGFGD